MFIPCLLLLVSLLSPKLLFSYIFVWSIYLNSFFSKTGKIGSTLPHNIMPRNCIFVPPPPLLSLPLLPPLLPPHSFHDMHLLLLPPRPSQEPSILNVLWKDTLQTCQTLTFLMLLNGKNQWSLNICLEGGSEWTFINP